MSESPIAGIELFQISLPTRREHKWTGLQEPIGGYVIIKMTDADGCVGWGEAPVLKDWGGEFGRYFGESPGTVRGRRLPVSGAGGHGLPARRHCRVARAHGPRAQGPPLCQGRDRNRGL